MGTAGIPTTGLAGLLATLPLPGEVELPDGSVFRMGIAQPRQPEKHDDAAIQYRVIFRTQSSLNTPMTELSIGDAFINNEIDVSGDMLAMFSSLRGGGPGNKNKKSIIVDQIPLRQKFQLAYDALFRSATVTNRESIAEHYDTHPDEFFLCFLDKRFRTYTQGLFSSSPDDDDDDDDDDDTNTLEAASERKLANMYQSLSLRPGTRLLDVGGGWGPVVQYAASRGVNVTMLTISPGQAAFVEKLLGSEKQKNPGAAAKWGEVRIIIKDFLDYTLGDGDDGEDEKEEPYDQVCILGVIEHLPDYPRIARKLFQLLKPGGKVYLDGSATRKKQDLSAFTREYIWPGSHSFMVLTDVLTAFTTGGGGGGGGSGGEEEEEEAMFDVVRVQDETKDYELTMLEWAKRMDENKNMVVEKWGGEKLYRIYRLYLWGGTHAFMTGGMQAYHWVLRRREGGQGGERGREGGGGRLGMLGRLFGFLKYLVY